MLRTIRRGTFKPTLIDDLHHSAVVIAQYDDTLNVALEWNRFVSRRFHEDEMLIRYDNPLSVRNLIPFIPCELFEKFPFVSYRTCGVRTSLSNVTVW